MSFITDIRGFMDFMPKIKNFVIIILVFALSAEAKEEILPEDTQLISFLNELFDNNKNFVESHDISFFDKFRNSQSPYLTIVKCSDSRISMEAFDSTPENDVFSIRNIGNQIMTSEGSVDYGVMVLKTPYLMIAGHSGCGAIDAAIKGKKTNISSIDHEISTIKPTGITINQTILDNIHEQVDIAKNKYKSMIDSDKLTIFGVVYDFKNDFGFGYGKVILVNVNGIKDPKIIKKTYNDKVKHLQFMN